MFYDKNCLGKNGGRGGLRRMIDRWEHSKTHRSEYTKAYPRLLFLSFIFFFFTWYSSTSLL